MVEVKCVFLLAIIAVVITAVPLKSARDNYVNEKLSVQKFLKGLQLSPKDALAMAKIKGILKNTKEYHQASAAGNLNDRNFRLPNNTEPILYDIRLSTDIHRGDFGFQGEVRIHIRALENTSSITLHSRETIITQITLFNPDWTVFEANLPFTYDSEVEFLVIPVNRGLETGQEIIAFIEYMGFLRTDLFGFFRTSYNDPDTNQTNWLATTQFQPINARHAFPCYDEVRYRRPIDLQIRHHRNYSAISNMPVVESAEDEEYATTIFERTLPIPTFVLAFTISDFDFVRNTDPDLDIRVYARPAAIAAGEGDDGLWLGETMLRTMENIFDIRYPLTKSDQVAIPRFASDGALNLGLITHREDIILQVNNDSVAQHTRRMRIGHEYSHIFFANLVAPSEWAFLWLNEGFATLYEIVLNGVVFAGSSTILWNNFLINNYDTAITIDVLGLMPALNHYVESPQDIRSKFDFITYSKGAVILRMIGDGLTRPTFEKGLSYYLLDRQLQNASPEDVYAGLQRAYDEDNPGLNLNITSTFSPWFDFAGYPVLTVRRNGAGVILQQEGFKTLHNETFGIPINYATRSQPNFNNIAARFWFTTRDLEVSSESLGIPWDEENDWIIFNLRDSAYFITNYDDELWDRIIDSLNNDHEIIHFFNRGTLFADFHRFISQDFDIRATIFLRLMESLPIEFNAHVWHRAQLGLEIIETRLRGSEFHGEYLDYVQELMSEIYGNRSFDDDDDGTATNIINKWSCLSGVHQCTDDALNVLIEVMETGSTDFEFDYQCNGLRAANATTWTIFYYSIVDSNSTEDRSVAVRDLLCTENNFLVSFYLNQVFNMTNSLSTSERELILTTAAVLHETSSYVLIELIESRAQEISLITRVSNLILQLVSVTNSYLQAERVIYLAEINDELTDELVVELMQPNLDFIYRNFDELYQWFSARNHVVQ